MVKKVLWFKLLISISLKVKFELEIQRYYFFTIGADCPTDFVRHQRLQI